MWLLAVAILSGAGAASALAAPSWERCAEGVGGTRYSTNKCTTAEGAGRWQWDDLITTEKAVAKGLTLTLADTKTALGETVVRCTSGIEPTVKIGPENRGVIEKFEVAGASEHCRGVKGGCEETKIEKVVGVNLPWQTTFFETTEKKVLTKIEADGHGEPGWAVTCKTVLGSKTDTCESEGESKLEEAKFENVSSAGALLVLATFEKAHKAKCSEGGKESGVVEGQVAIPSGGGEGLRVGTTGHRPEQPVWVICEEKSGSGTKWEDNACTKSSSTGKYEIQGLTSPSETRGMTATGEKTQTLEIGTSLSDKVVCKKMKLDEGAADGGEPASAGGAIELEECEVEGHAGCEIDKKANKIKSEPLNLQMVFLTKEAAEKKNPEEMAFLTKPKTAGGPFFGDVELTGAECPTAGKFEIKGEILYDAKKAGMRTEGHTMETSAGTTYYVNESGAAKEDTLTPLNAGKAEPVTFLGVALFVLTVLVVVSIFAACAGWWG